MTSLATGPSILVVDDDLDVRSAIAEILAEEGYRVIEAAGGREALAYLKASPPPALILLDLMMPDMDGWQFRKEQREASANDAIRFSAREEASESTARESRAAESRESRPAHRASRSRAAS